MKKPVSTERVLTNITEFLIYPMLPTTHTSRAKKSNGPCIFTSAEAIAIMEAKTIQKEEEQEQEAKEFQKKKSEEKKQQREQEKITKAEKS